MPLPESGRITIEEICEEFGVTASSVDLSNDLGPLIGKTAGTRVKLTDFYGASAAGDPFKIKVKMPSGNTSYQINLQTSGGTASIVWGDGNSETSGGSVTHTYPNEEEATEYTIEINDNGSSKFEGFTSFWARPYYEHTIIQWGDIKWKNNSWFKTNTSGQYLMRISVPVGSDYKPDLSLVTSLAYMFGTTNVSATDPATGFFEDTNNNLEDWDVSTITDMTAMFRNPDPIATKSDGETDNVLKCKDWDVSNVTNFTGFMQGYSGAVRGSWSVGLNIEMDNWDTSGATNMSFMFWNHGKTKPGIENFRTENVTNLTYFYGGGIWNAKTKMVNSILRWDVSNVTEFDGASMVCGNNETTTNANFPNNWRFSTDNSKNVDLNHFCGGNYMRNGAGPYFLTDLNAFATKTISESWYGGTSYTAWNMDRVSNVSNFGGSTFRGIPPLGDFRNYNIGTWEITSNCVTFGSLFISGRAAANEPVVFDQDMSGWDISGISSNQGYFMRGQEYSPLKDVNMSVSNYDATLVGWGAHASSANSGVTVNFGITRYTAGGTAESGKTALENAGWTITDGGYEIYSQTYNRTAGGEEACEIEETEDTFYHTGGSSSNPSVNDYAYKDNNHTSLADGTYKYLKRDDESTGTFTVESDQITAVGNC